MFVLSGVSSDKYEVAKDTIIEEFNKIQAGQFDDSKLALAKRLSFHKDKSHKIEQRVLLRF